MDPHLSTGFEDLDVDSDTGSDVTTHSLDTKKTANSLAFSNFVQAEIAQQLSSDQTPSQKASAAGYESLIDKAREYQQELFDRAKEENIIAVLDTGSGKTLIAALLIKYILEQELINRADGQPPQIVFFLVNSVHLARQQARFLEVNLPNPVISLFGDASENLWSRPVWDKIFQDYDVVVCTPAVLDSCLSHSYLKIDQISLLIFDEAHHCKKKHPYSNIIRDHYLGANGRRPRIFGMTASPVDSKHGDVAQVAKDLEERLQSKIVTTNDPSVFEVFAPRAKDVFWQYPELQHEYDTELCSSLRALCGFVDDLKRFFNFSRSATKELGSWAADRVWKHALASSHESHESTRITNYLERSDCYLQATEEQKASLLHSVQDAVALVNRHHFGPPDIESEYEFSPKLRVLYDELRHQYSQAPTTKTIVFLTERLSAFVLCDCFKLLDIENLRPGVLIGVGQPGTDSSSWKDQEAVMERFRDGGINLIFATNVAEEGIDIPECSFVVRFDLYRTPIQYMQSRGRARMKGSTYAHMLGEHNPDHESTIHYAIEMDNFIKDFCRHLPPDRKLGKGSKLKQLIEEDASSQCFETVTGVKANLNNSLVLLSRYVHSLQTKADAKSAEIYQEMIAAEGNMFRYKVILPATEDKKAMQVKGAIGDPRRNKVMAKRSAALNCCYKLRAAELLDENLDSIFRKMKPANLNKRLAVPENKDDYKKKLKPDFWLENGTTLSAPTALHATRVVVFIPTNRSEYRHFLLFTRALLPEIPRFSVFLEDNVEHHVIFERCGHPVAVSAEQVEGLTKFTLNAVFEDIFNKVYEPEPHLMSYWVAPAPGRSDNMEEASRLNDLDFESLVDFEELRKAFSPERERWSAQTSRKQGNHWVKKYLVDPGSGNFHYFTHKVVQDVSIWDPPPASAAQIRKKHKGTIIEFSDSTYRAKTHGMKTSADRYDPDQPVLEATVIMSGRNWLDKAPEDHTRMALCYIAPQPLEIGRLSFQNASVLQLLPSVLHKLESFLVVGEALHKLDLLHIPLDLALQAFTQDSNAEADKGHDIQDDNVINMEDFSDAYRQVSSNYERLEFIGDSLLKMMTTITVFNRTTCNEEGMHCKRMEMLSNRRLYSVASKPEYELFQYIRSGSAEKWRDTWYPEFLCQTKGRKIKLTGKRRSHALGQKTIADVCEAVIGASIMTTRHLPTSRKFDLGIQAITKLVEDENHDISTWQQVAPMYQAPDWSLLLSDPVALDLARKVQNVTGYRFKHPRLLRSAFTHSSDQNSPVPDLQRLEFLGDACLDWVCIWWLFSNNETRGPQWLTEHKMAMVSNKFLAALAVTLGFNRLMSASNPSLFAEITKYAAEVDAMYKVEGVKPDFWTKLTTPPPKSLADLVESYLGAVLVDSGFDFGEIEKFFDKHVLWFFKDIRAYDTFANRHPITYLMRLLREKFKCYNTSAEVLRQFSEPSTSGGNNADGAGDEAVTGVIVHVGWLVHGKVIARSGGQGARYAKVRASKSALKVIGKLSTEEFRERFKCDCAEKKSQGAGKQDTNLSSNGVNGTDVPSPKARDNASVEKSGI
ncbi:uncharacterized protein A1O9_08246 [Exophiala aquamarina CBS 119918]|uniref:Dicer-like protein 1 n=1 Tax=Exophiala aquamarina CBS 119918 TaxID=1182545 RepID=A0A072P6K2_9EURO|nr:uncharacterized protein A1O9_08246 [Exophiala aquamarina CBS 119918]KEF55496.1 hypothetical protein A1O9_08246 [Exophiala aquamarina CBS 119918]